MNIRQYRFILNFFTFDIFCINACFFNILNLVIVVTESDFQPIIPVFYSFCDFCDGNALHPGFEGIRFVRFRETAVLPDSFLIDCDCFGLALTV